MLSKIKRVCLGGTFEVLHRGHRSLLKKAIELGKYVIIGLTTDERAKKHRPNRKIKSFESRFSNLDMWLTSHTSSETYQIVPLDDDWGPSALDNDIDAIIVSEETEKVALKLNQVRQKKGLSPLQVIIVPLIRAYDGQRISSSRIINKEIDSEGFSS